MLDPDMRPEVHADPATVARGIRSEACHAGGVADQCSPCHPIAAHGHHRGFGAGVENVGVKMGEDAIAGIGGIFMATQ